MSDFQKMIRKNSEEIFSCIFDWNEDGGEPVNLKSYQSALHFLIWLDENIGERLVGHFELNLCPNGTVDFTLHEAIWGGNKSTLINFKKDLSFGYYGYVHDKSEEVEGNSNLDTLSNEHNLIKFIIKHYTSDQETKG